MLKSLRTMVCPLILAAASAARAQTLPQDCGTDVAAGLGRLESRPHKRLEGRSRRLSPVATKAVAWQAALDRAGFSPGIIDGIVGPKTRMGFRAFQAHAGLPVTGRPDAATVAALEMDSAPAVRRYVLTDADAARVGPAPRGWVARSKLKRLGYRTLASLAAERGHCTRRLLTKLNPGVDLDRLKAGDVLVLPNVPAAGPMSRSRRRGNTQRKGASPRGLPSAARLEIDFDSKVLRVFDAAGDVVGLFHCSIAADRARRPHGPCRVKTIALNPSYLFDPVVWPEVKDVDRRLVIPPGPRNPVGVCWIGLSIAGYGIHGTPAPELIGRTGSHGCFRLTNWDVLRLAKMLRVGVEVRFVEGAARVASGR